MCCARVAPAAAPLTDPAYTMPAVPILAWAALAGLLIVIFVIKTLLRLAAVIALVVVAAVAWKQGWLGPGFLNGLADTAKQHARDLAAVALSARGSGG